MAQLVPISVLLVPLLLLLLATEGWGGTPATAEPLRIGVPVSSPCPKYVKIICNRTSNECFDGFSIQVFRQILHHLHYKKPYILIPYNGSYDSLIESVFNKKFDAAVGDVSVVANRTRYVDFSRHYTEKGLQMVVYEEPESGKAWMFVKPFTKWLWIYTGAIFLYNGIMVWLIERAAGNQEHLEGSFWCQIGSLVWLTFTTLFPIHGEKLKSNFSRVAMVVWLFVALVLTQSYTANLTSMLTVRRLRPSVLDLETLRRSTSAMVGCDDGSFVVNYLQKVLHFDKSRIKTYSSGDDYAQDLASGKIKAAFLELAYAKVFLDENKKGFAVTGPIFDVGGYGFVFAKGSSLVNHVSNEILELRESGELLKLEESLVSSSSSSSSSETNDKEYDRLNEDIFEGLFLVTGGTSTLAFLLFQLKRFHDNWCKKKQTRDGCVPKKDWVSTPASPKEAPQMIEIKGAPDHNDWWQNAIRPNEFKRSNTL